MRYLLVLLLAGCVKEGGWTKRGATEEDFYRDRGACVAQAYQAPTPHQQRVILIGCMQSKGWYWEER